MYSALRTCLNSLAGISRNARWSRWLRNPCLTQAGQVAAERAQTLGGIHGVVDPLGQVTVFTLGAVQGRELAIHLVHCHLLPDRKRAGNRSEEHTSELQSLRHLVC